MKPELLRQEHSLNVLIAKVEYIMTEIGFKVGEPHFIDARSPNYYPVPAELHEDIFNLLKSQYSDGLYSHQAEAIRKFIDDEQDICLATSTSSGKSLAFMTAAADLLRYDSLAKIIAFYPVKALIRDQLRKWEEIFEPLNLKFGFIDGNVAIEDRLNICRKKFFDFDDSRCNSCLVNEQSKHKGD